ncbi:MAG: hypothetical protein HYV17_07815 [Xanthomonadales bacterium]|nr:hypothetical protein [Xanthomonadales bacterium]
MKATRHAFRHERQSQQGLTLIIAIILLLLVTVLSLFALNVGVFEQKTSGNDYRARMVNKTAEMAISQGMEYLNLNRDIGDLASGAWTRCGADEESFPCGAVPATVNVDGVDIAYRGNMFRFGGGTQDVDSSGGLDDVERRMLPLDRRVAATAATNGFAVEYGVGALLCRVQRQDPRPNPLPVGYVAPPARCTAGTDAGSIKTYTLVGRARIPGEGASATLTQTVGAKPIVADAPSTPPIVANGTVNITGTLQVVTNPNSAGPGVPVSVWTRSDVDRNGTPNTCYFDEFFRFGSGNNSGLGFFPIPVGHTSHNHKPIIVCDDCSCPSENSISYPKSGNLQQEGEDILDIDGNVGVNRDVRPQDYPCDLFAFIFGQNAWEDTDGDLFCETKLMAPDPDGGADIGADEAFLKQNAIIIDTNAECSQLDATANGVYWVQESAGCADIGGDLGTPYHPAIVVWDRQVRVGAQGRVFGLLFVRSSDGDFTVADVVSPATGGNAEFRTNGKSAIYGAVVVQGTAPQINGTAAIIYSKDVLEGFTGTPFERMSSMPGSWTDQSSY